VAKKAKVVQSIVEEAEIDATVYDRRAQDILDDLRFHSAVSRAAGSIRQLLNWMSDSWMNVDRLLAIKGPRWVDERGDARHRGLMNQIELRKLVSYPMPGTQSESVVIELKHAR
jgi:16S rRNA (guanine527-N7)-methyltransferase